jgi:Zn-dependent protease
MLSLINLSLQPPYDLSQIDVIVAFMIILAFLISIALHECGHVLMASWLGDNTPRAEGRQTLSFRPHIDPVGLLMCIILAFQPIGAPPVGLGWGKPVKPDPWKMKVKPDTGVLLVACAGIVTSLLVGLIITALLVFVQGSLQSNILGKLLLAFLIIFGLVNIAMAIFNLIPLYPLDGYQIVYTLLPSKQALKFARSAPYGPFIILVIFFFLPFIGNLTHASSFFLFHLSFYIWQVAALVMNLLGSHTVVYSL